MTPGQRIGAHVRQLRQARGMSIRDLADRLDGFHSNITALENGRRCPTVCTLLTLSRALGVTMAELVACFDDELEVAGLMASAAAIRVPHRGQHA